MPGVPVIPGPGSGLMTGARYRDLVPGTGTRYPVHTSHIPGGGTRRFYLGHAIEG